MGCISSKPSTHHHIIIPNHHLLNLVPPSNTNHTIHESTPPKHDHDHDTLTNINLKVYDDALERCSKFHTVEEYDELLQRITNHNDAELGCKNDSNTETRDNKKQDITFQTEASLRQWLQSPGGAGGSVDVDAATTTDYTTLKAGFSFYENNINSNAGPEESSILFKMGTQEEESMVEMMAAFDKYMQQLQIDEDNILKQIHNTIN